MPEENSTSSTNTDERSPKPEKKGSKGGWIILAILIAMAAAGASGYTVYRLELEVTPKLGSVTEQSATFIQQADALKQNDHIIEENVNELSSMIDQLASSNKSLNSELDDIVDSISALYQKKDTSAEAWRIEEISQLIAIGNHRLQFAGDFVTAADTRRIADQQLERLNDPRFVAVRRALNDEIAVLEQTSTVSVSSISLKILAYARTVDELPLRTQNLSNRLEVGKDESEVDSGDINSQNIWVQIKQDVFSLIRVRKTEDRITPALNQDQQSIVVEHLRLLLQVANVAALQSHQEVYVSALEDAITWLQVHFDSSDPKVSFTVDSIKELSKMTVEPKIPEVAESINLLRSIQAEG